MWMQGLWEQEDMWGAIHSYEAVEPKDTNNDKNFLVMGPWRHSGVNYEGFSLGPLPVYKKELQLMELEAARAAGVDALVAVYHSDHRELCAHERDWPFRIANILEIVGESMGLAREDRYKNLKIKQDVDAILADTADLMRSHALDATAARNAILSSLLGDQPLPLHGAR